MSPENRPINPVLTTFDIFAGMAIGEGLVFGNYIAVGVGVVVFGGVVVVEYGRGLAEKSLHGNKNKDKDLGSK